MWIPEYFRTILNKERVKILSLVNIWKIWVQTRIEPLTSQTPCRQPTGVWSWIPILSSIFFVLHSWQMNYTFLFQDCCKLEKLFFHSLLSLLMLSYPQWTKSLGNQSLHPKIPFGRTYTTPNILQSFSHQKVPHH